MKNIFKVLGIIALVTVIGFSISCGGDDDGDNTGGGGGGDGGGNGNGSGGEPTEWTAVTDSKFGTSAIWAIAYGNGKFVAGGNDGKMAWSTGN